MRECTAAISSEAVVALKRIGAAFEPPLSFRAPHDRATAIPSLQPQETSTINVRDVIAKKRGGRRIPMHPELRRALERLAQTREPVGPIIRSYRGSHLNSE